MSEIRTLGLGMQVIDLSKKSKYIYVQSGVQITVIPKHLYFSFWNAEIRTSESKNSSRISLQSIHATSIYSECPKSERSVWKTQQKMVCFQHVPISDVWAVRFARLKKLDHFIYLFPFIAKTV